MQLVCYDTSLKTKTSARGLSIVGAVVPYVWLHRLKRDWCAFVCPFVSVLCNPLMEIVSLITTCSHGLAFTISTMYRQQGLFEVECLSDV
jgi:hypothetical protein